MKYILLIVLAVCASSCKAEDVDFGGMESSEKSLNERHSKELIAYMSLETMFQDRQVRALAEAAAEGKVKELEELVTKGVDVNSQGAKGATPLFWSLRNSNFEGFKKLLSLGANPNIVFADSSVMHWAARHKDTRFLREALDQGGNPNLAAGKLGETPLFATIGVKGSGNIEAMRILLDSGADINAVTGGEKMFGMSMGGITPVLAAADVVRFDIVYELLKRGANYRFEDDSGRDLVDRIVAVKGRFAAGSEQKKYLEKVIAWLREHGMHIPEG